MTAPNKALDINSLGNPVLEAAYKYFCKHLVCLACRCDPIDAAGNINGKPKFFGFSAQILSVRGVWHLLTAGHIIEGIKRHLESGKWKMQFFLADDFGPEAVHHQVIPFDYEGAPKTHIDQDGVDFGIAVIRPYYRALLEKNKLVPIGEENWVNQHKVEYEHYFMLGFPTELVEVDIRPSADGYELTGTIGTAMLYVTKLDSAPPGSPVGSQEQFVGQIGPGGLSDIDGMSGCPIFGFAKGKSDEYWIVAIQNSWLPRSRVVFGTPIPVLGRIIEEAIQSVEDEQGTGTRQVKGAL